MRWVEIVNVMVNKDGLILVIKDGSITGMKYVDVDFTSGIDLKNTDDIQKLCIDILDYSNSIKYENPSLAQLLHDCTNVILDNISVGSWVQDDFYFKETELC